MTTWLLFATEQGARTGEAEASFSMQLPTVDGETACWAEPRQIALGDHAGKWGFAKPPAPHDAAVTEPHEEAPFDPAWWPQEP